MYMPIITKDRFGKIQKHHTFHIKTGAGMMNLTPAEQNIGRVGGIPNKGERNAHLIPPPPFKEITNYKVQPKSQQESYAQSGMTKALNNIRTPSKKLNNLKFEL